MNTHRSPFQSLTSIPQRLAAVTVVATMLLAAAPVAHAAPKMGGPRADVVIVRLDGRTRIEAINAQYATEVLDSIADLPGVYLLRVAPGSDVPKVLGRMLHDRRFVYAELDSVGQPPIAQPRSIGGWRGLDPAPFLQQPTMNVLGIPRAQAITRGGGSVVAVLDTGVQLDHPMLAGSFTEARYDFIDNDPDPTDTVNDSDDDGDGVIDEAYGHGTHIAGIVHLIAPDARIMPLRVLEADGNGYVFSIAKAIAFAARHGAHVINLSLGTAQASLVLHDAVADAQASGALVVAAAGNVDWLGRQYPAADDSAVGITSVSDADAKSSFANYGAWVDAAAPGENVVSTYPGSGYAMWSGTSMAAPFASGQAALIRSVAPGWGVADVVNVIQHTAVPLIAVERRYGELLGSGRIDIGASVEWASTNAAPPKFIRPKPANAMP